MQIRDMKFYILEGEPQTRQASPRGTLEKVPPGLSGLFTHAGGGRFNYRDEKPVPTYKSMLRLVTGNGQDAFCDFGSDFYQENLEWEAKRWKATIGHLLIGVDAFDREYIWQRLWYAQRFFYTGRQIVDQIDNMLWNFASQHAKLPLYKFLGGYRDKIPAYRNIGGGTIDALVADAVRAKEEGFFGCKDHSYRGVKGNIEMAKELRAAVGDDFWLMHDPVESYTCSEAVKVGRALEKYNYAWMEEPLQDHDLMGLKKLSDTLDLPILALEWSGAIGGQPFNASPFLALGACDIVRQRAVGITGQMKLAHLAESFGVDVHGGNPHVILAIKNDPIFESVRGGPLPKGVKLTVQGQMVVEDGYMYIAYGDAPVEAPDWDEIERAALAVV